MVQYAVCSRRRSRAGSIVSNTFAGVPVLFLNSACPNHLLVRLLMNGAVGGLPLILAAIIIIIKTMNPEEK